MGAMVGFETNILDPGKRRRVGGGGREERER